MNMHLSKILLVLTICNLAFSTSPTTTQEQLPTQLNQTVEVVDNKSLSSENYTSSTLTTTQESKVTLPKRKRLKRPIDPIKKEQEAELLRASAQLGIGIALTSGIYYLVGEPLNLSMLLGPIIGNLFTGPLGNIGTKLSLLFAPKLAKSNLQKGVQLKSAYQKQKAHFSKSMRGFIEVVLQRYFFWIEYHDYVDKQSERAIEEVLQFPVAPKKIDTHTIPSTRSFLQNYPEKVRVAVGSFVAQLIKDSTSKKLSKKAVPLMLVGPPGTGKTYLATQLGQLLNVPTQVIDISKYESLDGHSFWGDNPERGILVDVLIGDQTAGGNFTNKILILDEVDKLLLKDKTGAFKNKKGAEIISFLLSLLETQETEAKLRRYNNATHDISHLKIILIGNQTFSEVLGQEEGAALESRVRVVKFDDFKDTQKLNIAQQYVAKRYEEQRVDGNKVDPAVIQAIVKEDTAAGYQGVRVMLQVIDQYIRILEQGSLIGDIAGVPPLVFHAKEEYKNRANQKSE
jgi:hypothetical protein